MNLEDQTKWFNENYIPYIAELLLSRDPIEIVIVPTPMKEALVAALSNPTLPTSEEYVNSLPADIREVYLAPDSHTAIAEDLRSIAMELVKDEAPENMVVQNPSVVTEADQFIRTVTRSMRIRESFYTWAGRSGFIEHLQNTNPLAMPTYNEIRNCYFMAQMIEFASNQSMQSAQNQLKQAVVGPGAFGG